MSVVTTAVKFAEDAAAETASTPPWVFGVTAFAVLTVLMIITVMIKVGD